MADNKRLSLSGRIATPRVPPAMSMEQVLARCIGASVRIQTAAPAARTLTGHIFAVSPSSPVLTLTSSASLAAPSSPSLASPAPGPASFTVLPIAAIQSFALLDLGPHSAPGASTPTASGASTPTSPRAGTPTSGSFGGGRGSGASTPRGGAPLPPLPALPALDPGAAQRRLAEAVGRLHGEEERRGKGVGPEAQALFDALYRTLPVEWQGKDILVSSMVVVGPPYGPAECRLVSKAGNQQALARVRKVVEMERKKMAAGNGTRGSAPEVKKGG